ncbi:unnamed protein product [Pleuronectes platessa]|uniref:Uncharacterized protein n=1 Tax=Pleuronectes platessa TaxID=8262 RepID=A0A9N7V6N8_PLEPL|nr:unnamed protein product [Pleuronectes platessa]
MGSGVGAGKGARRFVSLSRYFLPLVTILCLCDRRGADCSPKKLPLDGASAVQAPQFSSGYSRVPREVPIQLLSPFLIQSPPGTARHKSLIRTCFRLLSMLTSHTPRGSGTAASWDLV